MRPILAIARREMRALFTSAVGYAVLFFFLLMTGIFFFAPLAQFGRANVGQIMGNTFVVLIFLAPALTMRLIAEEKRSGTIELLMTAPVTDAQVVLGKFLGVFGFFGVVLAATLQMPIAIGLVTATPAEAGGIAPWIGWAAAGGAVVLSGLAWGRQNFWLQGLALAGWVATVLLIGAGFGSPVFPGYLGFLFLGLTLVCVVIAVITERPAASLAVAVVGLGALVCVGFSILRMPERGPMLTAYVGLAALGATMFAVGILTSVLTRNQIVAWAMAVVILLGFLLIDWVVPAQPQAPSALVAGAGIGKHLGHGGQLLAYGFKTILKSLALGSHLENFSRGVLDFREVFLYLSLTVVFLIFSIRALATTRWQ